VVVILFLLLLAAIAGVLGAVLKAVAFIVLTAVLTAVVLGTLAVYALRRKLERVTQRLEPPAGQTRIHVGEPHARREPGGLPGPRDDRY
jgi:membrane protein implicated in regulation of membrane protease activity